MPGRQISRTPDWAATSGPSCRRAAAIQSPTGTVKPRLRAKGAAAGTCSPSQRRSNHLPSPSDLELVGQAEGELGDTGSRNGVRPSTPCAIRQRSSLVRRSLRQPIGAIDRLRDLQPGAAGPRRARLRRRDAVAPAGKIVAQHAQPVEIAARRAASRPPAHHGRISAAIAAIAGEELVAALARENDLEPGLRARAGASL